MPHLHLTDIPSRDDMLAAIKDFLVANGWTLDLWAGDTSSYSSYRSSNDSGEGKRLHVHHNDFYMHMRTATRQSVYGFGYSRSVVEVDGVKQHAPQLTGIAMYPSRGFTAYAGWDRQPLAPYYRSPEYVNRSSGTCGALFRIPPGVIPSCHIAAFTNPHFVSISVEHAVGTWRHMIACDFPFFELPNAGLFYGGSGLQYGCRDTFYNQYFLGEINNWTGSTGVYAPEVRVAEAKDCGGWTFISCGLRSEEIHSSYLTRGTLSEPLLAYSAPTFAGVHPLLPYFVSTYTSSEHTSGDYILGQLPHFRLTLTSAYTPEQVIQVGDERWMVLPVSDAENPHAIAVRYDGD